MSSHSPSSSSRMPLSSQSGEDIPMRRKIPDFILQGAKRERLAKEIFESGAAPTMETARVAARGIHFAFRVI